MAVPFIPSRKTSLKKIKKIPGWPAQCPYHIDQAVVMSSNSVGRKVKSCPSNSSGETIFRPEWYHGNI